MKRAVALPWRPLLRPKDGRRDEWLWLRQHVFPVVSCLLFVLVILSLATFPGEPHVNLFTGQPLRSAQCERWFHKQFDRLILPNVNAIDVKKLAEIEKAVSEKTLEPGEGERTRDFSDRDISCSDLAFADLRSVNLNGARMLGVSLMNAKLQRASLNAAQLQNADLDGAKLQNSSLLGAHLQGTRFVFAQMQGASLWTAKLGGRNSSALTFKAQISRKPSFEAHISSM